MSKSNKKTLVYGGYELIAIEEEKKYWNIYICSRNTHVEYALNRQVVTGASSCKKAFEKAKGHISRHAWKLFAQNDNFEFYIHKNFDGDYEYKIVSTSAELIVPVLDAEIAEKNIAMHIENYKWKFAQETSSLSIYTRQNPLSSKWEYGIEKNGEYINCENDFKSLEEAIENALLSISEIGWELTMNYDMFQIYTRTNSNGLFDYKTSLDKNTIDEETDFSDKQLMLITAIGRADKYYQKLKDNHQV